MDSVSGAPTGGLPVTIINNINTQVTPTSATLAQPNTQSPMDAMMSDASRPTYFYQGPTVTNPSGGPNVFLPNTTPSQPSSFAQQQSPSRPFMYLSNGFITMPRYTPNQYYGELNNIGHQLEYVPTGDQGRTYTNLHARSLSSPQGQYIYHGLPAYPQRDQRSSNIQPAMSMMTPPSVPSVVPPSTTSTNNSDMTQSAPATLRPHTYVPSPQSGSVLGAGQPITLHRTTTVLSPAPTSPGYQQQPQAPRHSHAAGPLPRLRPRPVADDGSSVASARVAATQASSGQLPATATASSASMSAGSARTYARFNPQRLEMARRMHMTQLLQHARASQAHLGAPMQLQRQRQRHGLGANSVGPSPSLDNPKDGRPEPKEGHEMQVSLECKICFTQLVDTVLLPCGHAVLCRWCAEIQIPSSALEPGMLNDVLHNPTAANTMSAENDGRNPQLRPYQDRASASPALEPRPDVDPDTSLPDTSLPKKLLAPLVSDTGSPAGSSTTNRAFHSASASFSHKRGDSGGAAPDDFASDDVSEQAVELASSNVPNGCRQAWQEQWRRSGTDLARPSSRAVAEGRMGQASPTLSGSRLPRDPAYVADGMGETIHGGHPSPLRSQAPRSSPILNDVSPPLNPSTSPGEMASVSEASQQPAGGLSYGQESARQLSNAQNFSGAVEGTSGEEKLIGDVRGIYAGIIMAESKCKDLFEHVQQSSTLTQEKYQQLTGVHGLLLQEYHDFFLCSQHPMATPALRRLAEKYNMPARLWRVGVNPLLETLHCRLPESLEHMLSFICYAYSMLTLMLESVPAFKDTWIECLGDLSRYRMAVEESDLRERESWAGIARYWFNQASDRNPNVGRIQHHLAVLARPDVTQQLFYYTRSLVSVHPFAGTRESIFLLFNPFLGGPQVIHRLPLVGVFVAAHGYLYTGDVGERLIESVDTFASLLNQTVSRIGAAFRLQGFFMCACNVAAMLEYGNADAYLGPEFLEANLSQPGSIDEVYASAASAWIPTNDLQAVQAEFLSSRDSANPSPLLFYGSFFTFHTLSVILDQVPDRSVYAACHVSLAFLWCLALTPRGMCRVEVAVPWRKLVSFLNTLFRSYIKPNIAERDEFPVSEETTWVAEDFLLRGQLWSQCLYPSGFFDNAPTAGDGRNIEPPSRDITRMYRCIWLGVRLAMFERWITYDFTARKFSVTPFALELEKMAEEHSPFAKPSEVKQADADKGTHET
ncbi:hypothetical protein BO78DRAFT_318238 [Aspergillus sclerotiicarbonarius CBS 121057]|uniref:Nonsense-mediated mRNA decay factor n=1 Tax=Aspergillus sclerotiicarbonarius (strain CBS 121057 / IBT 28362) TaxID=1448318 RepID=A0A319ENE2_ASPSB|nr:hypothetical protein BO78DRAFT_318238 [Aspergillus sclerotiicarbonarius CBS 121057]